MSSSSEEREDGGGGDDDLELAQPRTDDAANLRNNDDELDFRDEEETPFGSDQEPGSLNKNTGVTAGTGSDGVGSPGSSFLELRGSVDESSSIPDDTPSIQVGLRRF